MKFEAVAYYFCLFMYMMMTMFAMLRSSNPLGVLFVSSIGIAWLLIRWSELAARPGG
jgi:hypothetical protein